MFVVWETETQQFWRLTSGKHLICSDYEADQIHIDLIRNYRNTQWVMLPHSQTMCVWMLITYSCYQYVSIDLWSGKHWGEIKALIRGSLDLQLKNQSGTGSKTNYQNTSFKINRGRLKTAGVLCDQLHWSQEVTLTSAVGLQLTIVINLPAN